MMCVAQIGRWWLRTKDVCGSDGGYGGSDWGWLRLRIWWLRLGMWWLSLEMSWPKLHEALNHSCEVMAQTDGGSEENTMVPKVARRIVPFLYR
jgi:hypothetical protein